MKIIVQKYDWNESVSLENVNFFSTATPIISPELLDLQPFAINEDSFIVSYGIENIDESNFQLYVQSSNVTFQVTNLKEWAYGQGLDLYFRVYETNPRQKFLVKMYGEDNQIFFTGIIYKDGVKFSNREEEIINITVVGFEKEFKEYYQNKKLKDIPNPGNIFSLTGFLSTNLSYSLSTNFDSTFLNLHVSTSLALFQVAINPYIYSPHAAFYNSLIFCRTGYNSFQRDSCSIYDWLNSMALPMGWIWLFYLGEFHLKERSDLNFPLLTLNYNDVSIEHSVENTILDVGIDNVIIEDGEFYSNKLLIAGFYAGVVSNRVEYVGGRRKNLYSQKNYYSNELNPFKALTFLTITSQYQLQYENKTMVYLDEQAGTSRFKEYNVYQPYPNVTNETYAYSNSIQLKPYVVSKENAAGLDLSSARSPINVSIGGINISTHINIGYGNFFVTNVENNRLNDFRYTGHAGHSLFKFNYHPNVNAYENYYSYAKSEKFKSNFKGLVRTGQKILIKIKVKQLITNPLQTIKIINYPYADFTGKTFTIQSLSFDYYNGDSELTLMMNENG